MTEQYSATVGVILEALVLFALIPVQRGTDVYFISDLGVLKNSLGKKKLSGLLVVFSKHTGMTWHCCNLGLEIILCELHAK